MFFCPVLLSRIRMQLLFRIEKLDSDDLPRLLICAVESLKPPSTQSAVDGVSNRHSEFETQCIDHRMHPGELGQYPIEIGLLIPEEPLQFRLVAHCCRCCFCLSFPTSDLMRNSRFTADSHWFSAQTDGLRELHIRSSCRIVQLISSSGPSDLKLQKSVLTFFHLADPPDKGLYLHIYLTPIERGGCDVRL